MAPKCLTIEEIRRKIVSMRSAGVTDADSEELRALRQELRASMLNANAPPSMLDANVPPLPQVHVRDCISDDFP